MLAHDGTRWWLAASEIVSTKNKANNAEQMRASKQSADGARTITGHGDVTMMDCRVNVTFDNFKYKTKTGHFGLNTSILVRAASRVCIANRLADMFPTRCKSERAG